MPRAHCTDEVSAGCGEMLRPIEVTLAWGGETTAWVRSDNNNAGQGYCESMTDEAEAGETSTEVRGGT